MKLYDTGVYLNNGQEIIPAAKAQLPVSQEEAARNTIAYSILSAHNTSGNMDKLQIKFDKLTSHDITFVGIIQTARASGLERQRRSDGPPAFTRREGRHLRFVQCPAETDAADGARMSGRRLCRGRADAGRAHTADRRAVQ